MNYAVVILTLFLTIVVSNTAFAQINTDEQLAAQYFSNQEFDKAVIYYEKLYSKTKKENYYYRLLGCFLELKEYKNAEKLVKKQTKKNPYQLEFLTDLAHVYQLSGEKDKARQIKEKAVKQLTPDDQQVRLLANGFLKYKEIDYAITTYLKGRKLLKDSYPFNFELANIYSIKGNTEAMLNEYLDVLLYEESFIQSVQNALQTALNPDVGNAKKNLLKKILIKNIQKHPSKKIYPEMLIWLYIQEKNFNGALIQAQALDKRLKEGGRRVVALAKLSLSNKDYEAAIKCYQYIIGQGPDNYNYITSKIELVKVYNEKITKSIKYTPQDLLDLEENYLSTLNELGKTATTSSLLRGLAHLRAFYLHDTKSAIELLQQILKIPGIKRHDIARSKIELADIYLLTGEIWEASLLYSQVDKAYKNDQLGEMAKFKNAKISFYTGDFKWAKAQLDVLKASTSKLISNDAMQLSILITDNIGIDTTEAPLLLFAKADLLAYQNKNEEALKTLDTLNEMYPTHTIADDILHKRYQININQKNYEEAAIYLQKIITDYYYDILADDALYNLATLYENQLDDKEKAAELYKQLLFNHQGSIYTVDARKRYRLLRGDVENEKMDLKE